MNFTLCCGCVIGIETCSPSVNLKFGNQSNRQPSLGFVNCRIEKQRLADFVCSKSTLPKLAKSTASARSQAVKNSVGVPILQKRNIGFSRIN
jgi:hypothetical protein